MKFLMRKEQEEVQLHEEGRHWRGEHETLLLESSAQAGRWGVSVAPSGVGRSLHHWEDRWRGDEVLNLI